jgi:uncharacterized protein (DUF433 family)
MPLAVKTDPSPLQMDEHGIVRIGGSRVMLELVVHAFDEGASADEIAARYPSLDLADVHATLAYILRHRSEVDAYMADSEGAAAEMRRSIEQRSPRQGLREGLERRLSDREHD